MLGSKWVFAIVLTGCLAYPSLGALLDVSPGYPLMTFDSTGVTSYTAATGTLHITAAPLFVRFTPTTSPRAVAAPRSVDINVLVDNTGALIGGAAGNDLSVSGTVTDAAGTVYSGVLLTGEVTAFGWQETGVDTDQLDFQFTLTGGTLAPLYGTSVALAMQIEHSTFAGSFATDFGGGAKGTIGPLAACENVSVMIAASPTEISIDGGTVDFTYTIVNNASLPLQSVAITDAWGAVPEAPASLGIGQTITLHRTEIVTPPFVNTLDVSGSLADNVACSWQQPITVNILPECDLTVLAAADVSEVPAAGGLVSFTYTITNAAALPLTDVVVTDAFGPVAEAPTTLSAGETVVLTVIQTVVPPFTDTVTVTGNASPALTCTQNATVSLEILPECDLSVAAVADPTEVPAAGGLVTFTYTIVNSAALPLTNLAVSNVFGPVDAPSILPAGQTLTLTHSRMVTPPFTDTVTATGDVSASLNCMQNVAVSVQILPECDLSVAATANPTEIPAAGGAVTFTYTITNAAALPMTDVVVTDAFGPLVSAPTTLAAGETVVLSVTQTVLPLFTDTITVTGNIAPTLTCTQTATVAVTALPECDLSVAATANPTEVPAAGGTVVFTYTVTNSADLPLANVVVNDNWGAVPDAPASLAAGQSVTLTRTQFMTAPLTTTVSIAGDLGSGVNCSATADVSITQSHDCELTVAIHTCSGELSACGDNLWIWYAITNGSTETLTDIQVTDSWGRVWWAPTEVGPGETVYAMRFAHVAPPFTDTVTVTGNTADGQQCTATAEFTFTVKPVCDLRISVAADPETIPAAGDEVTFTYTITNDAALPMTGVQIRDSFGDVPDAPTTIEAGQTLTLTVTEFVTPPFTNNVHVTGSLSPTVRCCESQSITIQPACAIELTVTACPQELPASGGSVTFTYVVRNTGTSTLRNVSIVDNWGTVTSRQTVAAGGTLTKTRTKCIVPPITNTVTAQGGACGSQCDVTRTVTVTARPECHLEVTLATDQQVVPAEGDDVTFTYTITNNATLPMTNVVVTDSFGNVPDAPTTIAAGQTIVLTAIEYVTPPFTNTLSVSGALSTSVTCTQTRTVTIQSACAMEVTATASPQELPSSGGSVTFTYVVRNGGTTTLRNVTITDNWGTVASGLNIAPGASVTRTRNKCGIIPPLTNVVRAATQTRCEQPCSDEASVTITATEETEGCSVGYWKNHTCQWRGYTTCQDFDTVFGVNVYCPNINLLSALRRTGGGVDALARQAVAALLNAAHPDVDFPLTTSEVIELVQDALAPGGDIATTASELEEYNTSHCPL